LLDKIAQLVDDMAALLSASALQLLGGCRDAATAWEALQASAAFMLLSSTVDQSSNQCQLDNPSVDCATRTESWETAANNWDPLTGCPKLTASLTRNIPGHAARAEL
jgi:hypothetical protein